MSVQITYFVHGTTTDNECELATGWLPGELSAKGRDQARLLGEQYAGAPIDVMVCSDLRRAIDSAELGFNDICPIVQDARLRECNYGDLNGLPNDLKDNLDYYIENQFPNGESLRDVEARMADLLNDINHKYDGKHVAFIAHQAPQLALEVLLNNKTWEEAIATDWRLSHAWQPGWDYSLT